MKRSRRQPLISRFEVQDGGKGVIAGRIDHLHIHSDSGQKTVALSPFASVPELPPKFVHRLSLSEPIIQKLLSDSGTAAPLALEGTGGVGKSVLALGICHDKRIRARFSDGIVWLNIGQEIKETKISTENRMKSVADKLNQNFKEYSEETYRTMLNNKSVLVALDDVWCQDEIEPFLINSGRSRLLYTSRLKGLAGPLGADECEVGTLGDFQAREFLAIWADRDKEHLPEPYASEILIECNGLTLALAMVGAALKDKPDRRWEYTLADLKGGKVGDVGVKPVGYKYPNLHASIRVGIDALDSSQKAKYVQLAVLLEDMAAHPSVLQALWGDSRRDIDDLVQVFLDRSLGSRDGDGWMRIHDLQLDYIRREHPDRSALKLQLRALRRSYHIVRPYPEQFSSQMIGRLLSYQAQPGIATFLNRLDTNEPRPRLRPLRPTLESADGQTMSVLELPTPVGTISLSADGRRTICGFEDDAIWVRNLDSKEAPSMLNHADGISAVTLSADGKRVLFGASDGSLHVWHVESNESSRMMEAYTDGISAVALSADGQRALFGSYDGSLYVWEPEGKQAPRPLASHLGRISAVALSKNGKRALSGSYDDGLRVWDLEGEQLPRVLEGGTNEVYSVSLSADGRYAVGGYGSFDCAVRVWDLESKQSLQVLEGHTDRVYAVAVSEDGRLVVSGSHDETVRLWDLDDTEPPRVLKGHTAGVCAVALTLDGKCVLSGSYDNTLRMWDLERNQPRSELRIGHSGSVYAVAISGDGRRAISGSWDHTVRVWDVEDQRPPRVLEGHTSPVSAVALSTDGTCALSGSHDNSVCVWDLEGTRPARVLEGHTDRVYAVALSEDGQIAVSGSEDKTLRVWDLADKQPRCFLKGHTDTVSAVALSADGRRALSGSYDGSLRIWDLEDMQQRAVLTGHTDRVTGVALSTDGKRALSVSFDNTIRVWDIEVNQPLRILEGLTGNVSAVALSEDGKRALTASYDNTLRIWDLKRGRQIAGFTCDSGVTSCAWRGKHVVAGDLGGQVHFFALEE